MKLKQLYFLALCGLGVVANATAVDLPKTQEIKKQIDAVKKETQTDLTKAILLNLDDTLVLLEQIDKQKVDTDKLRQQIATAAKALKISQENIEKLKTNGKSIEQLTNGLSIRSLDELKSMLSGISSKADSVQSELTDLHSLLLSQKTVPERTQVSLSSNVTRMQELNKLLAKADNSESLKNKLATELELLQLKNEYSQILLNGNDALTSLYTAQVEEKTVEQQQLQAELNALQTAINAKNLQASQKQVAQAEQSKEQNSQSNPLILRELDFNTKISEELLSQTATLNALSQDNLRIKNVLDNLQQTQRNIEEQISALQGTLVLSRIINKQQQSLPQDQLISGLSKQITDLRVRIFDITEFRDRISDTDAYITNLERSEKTQFSAKERSKLSEILQERDKVLADLLKQLNNQLNLSINIELNQKQVQTISQALQSKLQEQSFWVKSNNPIDLTWFRHFFNLAGSQVRDITKALDFSNWRDNALPAGGLIALLLALYALIIRRKKHIKQYLTDINNQLKTIKTDSQWLTPKAIFWTLILCLPSTLLFLTAFVAITYIAFRDPTQVWAWGLKMAAYWLYFTFMIALLRPNGMANRHFKMPPKNAENFSRILKSTVWIVALLVNTSIFTHLESGVSYDVLGQVLTILVLVLTIFIIGPAFRGAISSYQDAADKELGSSTYLLTFIRIVLLLAPVILIGLIVMGYYYTALVLIEHLILSYLAFTTWLLIRNVVYRSLDIYARRLARRRLEDKLEEKREKALREANMENKDDEDPTFEVQDESLAVNDIKGQVQRMADFVLWIGLFVLIYMVWSDLLTVAYYLDGVTLWQQSVAGATGTVMESVTLLNLLIAMIVLAVTYVLVRNIGGLLEMLIFSHIKLSQGTPYTLTTLLTYILIAVGAALAFSTLGMSWSKLQWLFAALSVGLGFGMQEIFANFVSGIIILFERPVRIGDVITIGQFSGTVSKIRIRATTLVDFDGKEVIVPNKAFVTERLVNWALSNTTTRVVIRVGVAYGSDLELVKKLLLQAANESERVLKEPAPKAFFLTFGASTLDHELRVYVDQLSDRNPTVDFLNRRINQLFNEHGIDIAFNQLDVNITNQELNLDIKQHNIKETKEK
ncbi:MAG: mechanosensitive channel MscK [Lonepinella koalarum]|nr:mechanosensitive channel MscK [Lonepinella koalarum]